MFHVGGNALQVRRPAAYNRICLGGLCQFECGPFIFEARAYNNNAVFLRAIGLPRKIAKTKWGEVGYKCLPCMVA